MRFSLTSTVLTSILISLGVTASPISHSLSSRAQCQAILDTALSVAHRLQDHYYDAATGNYNGGALWTDANAVENLHNLMLAANNDDFADVSNNARISKVALSGGDWESVLAGSNDDAGWIWLALIKIGDYKSARGQDATPYLNSANRIYDIVSAQWDDGTCGGGGSWWSYAHTYKNAITNQLYLTMSASGYLRNHNQTYLDNAKKTWDWLSKSGMRNSDGLFNDGLTNDCKNNGQTTWTYNQGTLAPGLAALSSATGDSSYLEQAEISLDATIAHLSSNSILKESCDDSASGGATCNTDQQAFKGLFVKHLQYYLDLAGDRVSKYSAFIGSQQSAVYHYGTNADTDIGSVWYAPSSGGSLFTPVTSSSGLSAHIVAAKYGPC